MRTTLGPFVIAALGRLASGAVTSNPKWPYGWLLYQEEYLLYESLEVQSGFTNGCPRRFLTTTAAQWIRLAYHDMSTHNVEDGTGGLDASIRFELDRPENIGSGMLQSLSDFKARQTPHVSMADVIAMGAIFSLAGCGGPTHASIPFRGGRKDATSAGPPGVPEPHQDLRTHTDIFKRQGFNQQEMIALVACGHANGGVRKNDFPDIVTGSQSFEFFTGSDKHNRSIVTGYLDGTTTNPLVVTSNVTLRSDHRVFGSDGNVTMKRLAEGNNFNTECASLIERMINTVPKDVKLTEPILPIEFKVGKVRLFPANDSDGLVLTTTLRTLDLPDNPKRTITLLWTDRQGSTTCPSTGCSVQSVSTETLGTGTDRGFRFMGITTPQMHAFRANVDIKTSISKFWFEIDEGDGNKEVVDNDAEGFAIDQETVLIDPVRSVKWVDALGTAKIVRVVVGVTTSELSSMTPNLTMRAFNPSTPPPFIPETTTVPFSLDTTLPAMGAYTFFTANVSSPLGLSGTPMTSFDVVYEGRIVQEFVQVKEILTSIRV
ncbi:hypothetical protein AAF712_005117 [Marasmius tenuissimus]|uniref:Peroxidase n=1 Tax=Marasmius tenuissimus TaxID=585030 RepID=A0ABR3A2S4_9AGAR